MFMCGARAGFYQGDVKLLIEDIKELKPTIFVTVPRLLNRVYDKVSNTLTPELSYFMSKATLIPFPFISASLCQVITGVSASPVKKFLFDRAMAAKLSDLRRYKQFCYIVLFRGGEERAQYHCS